MFKQEQEKCLVTLTSVNPKNLLLIQTFLETLS